MDLSATSMPDLCVRRVGEDACYADVARLPALCLTRIADYLGTYDNVRSMRQVCRRWRHVSPVPRHQRRLLDARAAVAAGYNTRAVHKSRHDR